MSPLVTNLEKLSTLLLSGHETWVARIAILTNTVMLVGTSSVSNRLEKKSFPTKQELSKLLLELLCKLDERVL